MMKTLRMFLGTLVILGIGYYIGNVNNRETEVVLYDEIPLETNESLTEESLPEGAEESQDESQQSEGENASEGSEGEESSSSLDEDSTESEDEPEKPTEPTVPEGEQNQETAPEGSESEEASPPPAEGSTEQEQGQQPEPPLQQPNEQEENQEEENQEDEISGDSELPAIPEDEDEIEQPSPEDEELPKEEPELLENLEMQRENNFTLFSTFTGSLSWERVIGSNSTGCALVSLDTTGNVKFDRGDSSTGTLPITVSPNFPTETGHISPICHFYTGTGTYTVKISYESNLVYLDLSGQNVISFSGENDSPLIFLGLSSNNWSGGAENFKNLPNLRYLVLTQPVFDITGYNAFLSKLSTMSFPSSGTNLYTSTQYGECVANAGEGLNAVSSLQMQGWHFDHTRIPCHPTVSLSPSSGSIKNNHSVTVTVNQSGGIPMDGLYYLWSTGSTATSGEIRSGTAYTGINNVTGSTDIVITKSDGSGSYYLHILAENQYGDLATGSSNEFIFDTTAPTVIITPDQGTDSTSGTSINYTIEFSKGIVLSGFGSDKINWTTGFTLSRFTNGNFNTFTLELNTTSGAEYTGTVRIASGIVQDAAGNGNTASNEVSIYVDRKAPTISLSGLSSIPTSGTVTLTVDASEDGVGFPLDPYSFDGGTTWQTGSTRVFTGNGTGTIKVRDALGNESSTGYEINNIDTSSPNVTKIIYDPSSTGTRTSGNVTVTLEISEQLTGITGRTATGNKGTEYFKVYPGNTNETVEFKDAAGNAGSTGIDVANIDKEVPSVIFDPTGGGNGQSYTVSVTVADTGTNGTGAGVNENNLFYLWTGSNAPTSGEMLSGTVFTNGSGITLTGVDGDLYLWIRAEDNVGNAIITGSDKFIFDNTSPSATITYSPSSTGTRTSGNVIVTLAISEQLTNITPGRTATGTNEYYKEYTGNALEIVEFEDLAGNTGSVKIDVANIDKKIPSVTFNPTEGGSGQSHTVSVTVVDTGTNGTGAGVNENNLFYLWTGSNAPTSGEMLSGTVFTNGSDITLTGVDGDLYLWIRAEDNAGNSIITGSSLFIFDNTPPFATKIVHMPSTGTRTGGTVTVGLVISEQLTGITQGRIDASSGVYYKTYRNNITGEIVEFEDLAGNTGSVKIDVANIDKEIPSVTFNPTGGGSGQFHTVSVTVVDTGTNGTGAGVNENNLFYLWTGSNAPTSGEMLSGTVFTNGSGITLTGVDGDLYLWIRAEDNVGNTIITGSNLFIFDNTPPFATITYSPSTGTRTSGNVIVTLAISEQLTGITQGRTATGTNEYYKEYTGNALEIVEFEDLAGNTGSAEIDVTNIDKIAPEIAGLYSPMAPTYGIVMVTITGSDGTGSGLHPEPYSFDGGMTWQTGNTQEYGTNQTILIALRDFVGNITTGSVTFDNILHYGGGAGSVNRDVCPDGDFSPSYYDGTCVQGNELSHNAPSSSENSSEEEPIEEKPIEVVIYERAETHNLTSMPTFEMFRPKDIITRAEMAKVMVLFAEKALSLFPQAKTGQAIHNGCYAFKDISDQSTGLQSSIVQACELGLMGYNFDGKTVKTFFNPDEEISIAEIATVVSRWLRGTTYRGSEERRYQNHFLALQKVGIVPRGIDPLEKGERENVYRIFYKLKPLLIK